jgi:hypothetical protein
MEEDLVLLWGVCFLNIIIVRSRIEGGLGNAA